jgi:RNA polymerase sigma-70 factor (ECF subfamily)
LREYNDEAELVARGRKGDLDAFNRLVERYERPLFNLCLRMLGSSQPAEDATQEAFINAYRSLGSFRGGSFRAWLFRIGANACYDEIRRRRSRPAVSLDEPHGEEERLIDAPNPGPTLDEHVENVELAEVLRQALAQLPAEQRLAVILSDVQGLEHAEIAEAMGVALGTVKSRVSRGRARLRVILLSRGELLPSRLRQISEGSNDVAV